MISAKPDEQSHQIAEEDPEGLFTSKPRQRKIPLLELAHLALMVIVSEVSSKSSLLYSLLYSGNKDGSADALCDWENAGMHAIDSLCSSTFLNIVPHHIPDSNCQDANLHRERTAKTWQYYQYQRRKYSWSPQTTLLKMLKSVVLSDSKTGNIRAALVTLE